MNTSQSRTWCLLFMMLIITSITVYRNSVLTSECTIASYPNSPFIHTHTHRQNPPLSNNREHLRTAFSQCPVQCGIWWKTPCLVITMKMFAKHMHTPVFPTPQSALSGQSRWHSRVKGVWSATPGRSSSGGCWVAGTLGWNSWNLWRFPVTRAQYWHYCKEHFEAWLKFHEILS